MMCLFVERPLFISLERGFDASFNRLIPIDQAVTDWISFLPSNLIQEISPDPEALSKNP